MGEGSYRVLPQGLEDWEVELEREAMHEEDGGGQGFEGLPSQGEVMAALGGESHRRGKNRQWCMHKEREGGRRCAAGSRVVMCGGQRRG